MDKRSERSELEKYYRGTDKASHLFVFDPNSNDADKDGVVPAKGFREVGVVVVPYTMKQSLTDDMDTANVSSVCIDSIYNVPIYDDDGSEGMVRHCELPLPERCKIHAESPAERAGSIMRLQIYGDAGNFLTENYTFRKKRDDGTIETTDVALPLNYRNYIVSYSSSKHKCYEYYYYNCERNKLTTHRYTLVGLITYLQNFPVRSTKTFAEGRYTWRRILEICFELFFHPRYGSAFKIYGDETLDALNNRKAYTNATLYDVVRDISQQLDRVPKLELKVSPSGSYTYQLMLFPKTGAGFGTTDMDFFNWEEAKVDVCALNQSAGSVISNARSLVLDTDFTYPKREAIAPNQTNIGNSWRIFKLPSAIRRIKEVKIYTDKKMSKNSNSKDTWMYAHVDNDGKRLSRDFTTISETDGPSDKFDFRYFYKLKPDNYVIMTNDTKKDVHIYLYEYEDYQYLPKDTGDSESGLKQPSQDKSIWYKRGSDEIHLDCLYDKNIKEGNQYAYIELVKWRRNDSGGPMFDDKYSFNFNEDEASKSNVYSTFLIAVTYEPIVDDAVLKGSNNLDGDITVLYNQLGEQVSATGFMDNLNAYAGDMEERSLQRGKVVSVEDNDPYAFANMWNGVPRVGSNIYDAKSNKQYVITELDYNVLNVKAEIIATLDEKSAGVAKSIRPNSDIELGLLSSDESMKSNTNIEYRVRIGLTPQLNKNCEENIRPYPTLAGLLFPANESDAEKFGWDSTQMHTPQSFIIIKNKKTDGACATLLSGVCRNSVYFIANFKHNKIAGLRNVNGNITPVRYAGEDGYLETMIVVCPNIDPSSFNGGFVTHEYALAFESIAPFVVKNVTDYDNISALPYYKDVHEISGFTLQVTYNGEDGILTAPALPNRSFYSNSKKDKLKLVLLAKELSPDSGLWKSYIVSGPLDLDVSLDIDNRTIIYNVIGLSIIPNHCAWAIVDTTDELRIVQNRKIALDSNNRLIIYYGIERIII